MHMKKTTSFTVEINQPISKALFNKIANHLKKFGVFLDPYREGTDHYVIEESSEDAVDVPPWLFICSLLLENHVNHSVTKTLDFTFEKGKTKKGKK